MCLPLHCADPAPIRTFRGKALTHEAAEDIFIGHIKARPGPEGNSEKAYSWLVAAGKNPVSTRLPLWMVGD